MTRAVQRSTPAIDCHSSPAATSVAKPLRLLASAGERLIITTEAQLIPLHKVETRPLRAVAVSIVVVHRIPTVVPNSIAMVAASQQACARHLASFDVIPAQWIAGRAERGFNSGMSAVL